MDKRYLIFLISGVGFYFIKTIQEDKKKEIVTIKRLIKKKTYTNEGDYVGKVEEVILGENKIDSLKIKLGKKFKGKGIIAKYKAVRDVGNIVLIDNKIMEKIDK